MGNASERDPPVAVSHHNRRGVLDSTHVHRRPLAPVGDDPVTCTANGASIQENGLEVQEANKRQPLDVLQCELGSARALVQQPDHVAREPAEEPSAFHRPTPDTTICRMRHSANP